MKYLTEHALRYVEENKETLLELILELCKIPAPSNQEEQRAEFCRKWFEENGAPEVIVDDALNVLCPINCDGDVPVTVFMAHTDIVFPDMSLYEMRIEDGRVYYPGVGDDTANLAILMLCAKYVFETGLTPSDGGVLFAANSGEEGLGANKGMKAIMERYDGRVKEVYSFDGDYPDACDASLGVERYRVEVLTEGGHSHGPMGNRSAIHYLAEIISDLYTLKAPTEPGVKTSYNVGSIKGGLAINAIAPQAEMMYEFRSASVDCMNKMRAFFESVIAHYRTMGIEVNVETVSTFPADADCVNPEARQALRDKVIDIMKYYVGREPVFAPGTSDADIPLSMGVPAIVFGGKLGRYVHSPKEDMEIDSLPLGFKILLSTVLLAFGRQEP